MHRFIHPSIHTAIHLSIKKFINSSIHRQIYQSIHPYIHIPYTFSSINLLGRSHISRGYYDDFEWSPFIFMIPFSGVVIPFIHLSTCHSVLLTSIHIIHPYIHTISCTYIHPFIQACMYLSIRMKLCF